MKRRLDVGIFDKSNRKLDVPHTLSRRTKLSVCIAVAMAGATMISTQGAQAAPKKTAKNNAQGGAKAVNKYEAEIIRLQEQLQAVQNQRDDLAQRESNLLKKLATAAPGDSVATPDSAAQVPVTGEPVTVAAKQEVDKSTDLGEVAVIGRRKNALEKLKDTPKSVSVVTGEELVKFQANDLSNIINRIGSVKWQSSNPRESNLTIRGVGFLGAASGQAGEAMDPSVGVNVDEVSYASIPLASSVNFADLETVDVTRGPQGTLGGKNTSLGSISFKTKGPTFTREADASITYGERNSLITKAAVGGAIFDDLLAWRGTFFREQADGPFVNAADDNVSMGNRDRTTGRLQFLLTPTEDFSARVKLEFTPKGQEVNISSTSGVFYRPTPNNYDTLDASGKQKAVNQALEPIGRLTRRWFTQEKNYTYGSNYLADQLNRSIQLPNVNSSKGASTILTWNNIANHTLTSITAANEYFFDWRGGQLTAFDISRPPAAGRSDHQQYSQELRINSEPGGLIDYQAGGYFLLTRRQYQSTGIRGGSDAGAYYATAGEYTSLDKDGSGRYLMVNSLDRLLTQTRDHWNGDSKAMFGNLNWYPSKALTVNAGLRLTWENRTDTNSYSQISDQGFGAELNPASKNNVQLGGFNNNATTGGLTTNTAAQTAVANFVAQKYFNVQTYDVLSDTQKRQVASAKGIRARQLGALYLNSQAEPFNGVLPTVNISPSYKLNDNQTTYFSWQHGEKAGISQFVNATVNGATSVPVKSETSNTFEIGLKSALLDKTLVVNADVFLHDINNYIQPLYFYDEAQTKLNTNNTLAYSSGLGNVPEVMAKGVELDVTYSGIPYTNLRFAGAYNDARYVKFTNSGKPAELAGGTSTPYQDVSGRTLPGSAKFTFNLFAGYARPLFDNKLFHTDVNYNYTSSYNSDVSLSRYSVVNGYGLTDFAIGFGRKDKLFDVNLIVKNLFDVDYGYLKNWNTYIAPIPRWVGVTVSTQL